MRAIGKITINGVEYDNPESMPSDIREKYERAMATLKDEDGDGIPDVLQGPPESNVVVKQKIVVNGKEYASRDELPEGMKHLLDQVFAGKSGGSATDAQPANRTVRRASPAALGFEQPAAKSYPWSLILALVAALALLSAFWLAGVSPADLLRRLR